MNKQELDDNKKSRIKIKILYLILFVCVISGITFALQLSSLSLAIDTAIVKIDEEVYGETSLDTSNLDLIPILDSEVETNTDNVLKIDFIVGGNKDNTREDIIYDIALVDLGVDCDLLSEYVKWKLVKNGELLSNGSLSYTFDTIKNDRLVLTEIQQDLSLYNEKQEGYDKYSFYLWISDPCQDSLEVCYANNDISDTSDLMGKILTGAIEVELYTDSKKALVRTPSDEFDPLSCGEGFALNKARVGSYVAYTGNNGCEGESCSGVNANSSSTSNGYCSNSEREFNSSGWRVAYVKDKVTYLVSAGAVECMCSNSDGSSSLSSCSSSMSNAAVTYQHLDNIDGIALKYCNTAYVKDGICSKTTVRTINLMDYEEITGSNVSMCTAITSQACGYSNDLIDNGGFYWFNNQYNSSSYFIWGPSSHYIGNQSSKSLMGVRPVIAIDSSVVVTGGSGTEDDPLTISTAVVNDTYSNTLKSFDGLSDESYFHSETYRENIKNISFVDYIDTTDAVVSWDMSSSNNGSIMAWLKNNSTSGYYDLYIGSNTVIKAYDLSYYFSNMKRVDSISFDNLDTSLTKNMEFMFYYMGYNSTSLTLDLGDKFNTSNVVDMNFMFGWVGYSSLVFTLDLGNNFNTSKVTDMDSMFFRTGYQSTVFTLDLGDKFNTSNVVNMRDLFYNTGRASTVFTLDLGNNFDTSNVVNMEGMFNSTGYNSTVFTLDLGDKFDTSNVVNMSYLFCSTGRTNPTFTLDLGDKFDTLRVHNMKNMFQHTGRVSTVFTLDLGDKFNTSRVNYMDYMFNYTGYTSEEFTLDLEDKFDTSKVTNMSNMFSYAGYNSEVFTLDLGDKFDTSNVTNMNSMFNRMGYYSEELTLDLGNKFNTAKVTNMASMFSRTGYNSEVFTLNLGNNFDTSNVTDMSYMFVATGSDNYEFTLDLGDKFNTAKVTNMEGMFNATGVQSIIFTLDLGNHFDTSNVTNMVNMFYQTGYSSTVFTLNLGSKFDTSKVTSMESMFDNAGVRNENFVLDLSTFNFDNVTVFTNMFRAFGATQTIYVKNASDQALLVSQGFANVTSSNVLIKT